MTNNVTDSANEATLQDLVTFIWLEKLLIILTTIIFTVAAAGVSTLIPDRYSAYALLASNSTSGGADLAGISGQLGGLAGLIGLGGGEDAESVTAIETLKSREFIDALVNKYELTPLIMADKAFDVSTGELELDETIYNRDTGQWTRDVNLPFVDEPNAWEIHKVFSKALSVSEDAQTGLITLSFEHISPVVASRVTTLLIDDINDHLRTKAIADAGQRIAYLQEQLQKTSLTELQQVFYTLIEEQTKRLMLADTRKDYAFAIIDPSVVPMESSSPNRPLIVVFGLFLGFLVGLVVAYLKGVIRANQIASR